jgi:hypothetical protein
MEVIFLSLICPIEEILNYKKCSFVANFYGKLAFIRLDLKIKYITYLSLLLNSVRA